MNASSEARHVVLVHGGFVGESGWREVYDLLKQDGYKVAVVQTQPCRSRAMPPRPGW